MARARGLVCQKSFIAGLVPGFLSNVDARGLTTEAGAPPDTPNVGCFPSKAGLGLGFLPNVAFYGLETKAGALPDPPNFGWFLREMLGLEVWGLRKGSFSGRGFGFLRNVDSRRRPARTQIPQTWIFRREMDRAGGSGSQSSFIFWPGARISA